MILQDVFPFGLINKHLILSKCQLLCIIYGRIYYLVCTWLCIHIVDIILNNMTVGMSESYLGRKF